MKKWLARLFRRWADRLDPETALVLPALLDAAKALVLDINAQRHTSSYKRAQAMKAMRQAFPNAPRRDLALAIELAVREVVPS